MIHGTAADSRVRASWLVVASFWILAALSYLRGFRAGLPPYAGVYWEVTYQDGFIKRGLVGTVFSFLFGGETPGARESLILWGHLALVTAIVIGAGLWIGQLVRNAAHTSTVVLIAGTSALMVTSQLLPSLAFLPGYLDALLLALLLAAALLVARGQVALACLLASIGPLVHEAFVAYWIPVALVAVAWRAREGWPRGRRLWLVLLPLVTTVAVVMLHRQSAAITQVTALGLRADVEGGTVSLQFGQSIGSAVGRALAALEGNGPAAILALIVCAGPAVVIAVGYLVARAGQLGRGEQIAVAASVLSPLALLLIVTDLSRFMVMAGAVAFLVVLMLESRSRAEPRVSASLAVVVALLCVGGLLTPLVYVDEEAVTVWRNGPVTMGSQSGPGFDAQPVPAGAGILGG